MENTTNVVRLRQPDAIDDPLTDVLRAGARRLLAQVVDMEAEAFLAAMQDLRLPDGCESGLLSGLLDALTIHRPRVSSRRRGGRARRASSGPPPAPNLDAIPEGANSVSNALLLTHPNAQQ